jgi:Tfp pilus assembly protein PilF
MAGRKGILWGGVATGVLAPGVLTVVLHTDKPAVTGAHLVNSHVCSSCHGAESAEWRQSQQHAALAHNVVFEFVVAQRKHADRAAARVNLGTFLAERGDMANAEQQLKSATRMEAQYLPAYIKLADEYRAQGRDADGERVLRAGLALAPGSALLHHALGLTLVRLKRIDAALLEFERATTLEPANALYAYVHALALHFTGNTAAAIANLERALAHHPADRDILSALASFQEERGAVDQAKRYADQLRAITNER